MTPIADPLTTRQTVIMLALGVVLWFLAALLMRALAPFGWLTPRDAPLLYALVVPGTVPFVLLARRVARLGNQRLLGGVAMATAAATLCDGVALMWYRPLYGSDPLDAAATILWGAGVALVIAALLARR